MKTYQYKDFSNKLLGMNGLSDTMLNNHFTLYKGYVDNANKLIELLDTTEKGSYQYNELKRRLGWEINGIKLHELYFENMNKDKTEMSESVKALLIENYKTIEEWDASLRRNGMIRGIGWVALMRDNHTGEIFHSWIGEHNQNNIVEAEILLIMDCWEHAYMTDYGIKKADYISAFINNIDWNIVDERLKK